MKLASTRDLASLKKVLKDPNASGPDPVYWVFSEISNSNWANITIMTAGSFATEYPKTFGHYHPVNAPLETYQLISGSGIVQLQKKHISNGVWRQEIVDEVFLVTIKPGDEVVISPEYGHCLINVGKLPLLTFDNWRLEHHPQDYQEIEKLKGLAYYLVDDGGQLKALPNPNYQDLPQPRWLTAKEFAQLMIK